MVELLIGITTLAVAIATLYFSVAAYRYARKSDQKRIKDDLARKEAMLKSITEHGFIMGLSQGEYNAIKPKIAMLEADIKELKKQLR